MIHREGKLEKNQAVGCPSAFGMSRQSVRGWEFGEVSLPMTGPEAAGRIRGLRSCGGPGQEEEEEEPAHPRAERSRMDGAGGEPGPCPALSRTFAALCGAGVGESEREVVLLK